MSARRPREPSVRNLTVRVVSTVMLGLSTLTVWSLGTPTRASATTYCGERDAANASAQTATRWSRVRAWGCLDVGGTVTAIGRGSVDHPSGCYSGKPPSCPPSFFKNNAEFHWLELTVKFAGRIDRCRFGPWLAVDRSFECASAASVANPPGAQDFTIESQMCFDVKDDGDPAKCTPWSTLIYTD